MKHTEHLLLLFWWHSLAKPCIFLALCSLFFLVSLDFFLELCFDDKLFTWYFILHLLAFSRLSAGVIISVTVPALYDKFEDQVDRWVGMIHRKFSRHYKIVDESLHSRLPRTLTREKDSWFRLSGPIWCFLLWFPQNREVRGVVVLSHSNLITNLVFHCRIRGSSV